MSELNGTARRIHFIDEVRGLCIVLMIICHIIYDLLNLFNIVWASGLMEVVHHVGPFISGTFILISGFSCRLSRDNCKRGAQLFIIASLLSVFSLIFMYDIAIRFGVLSLLSVCMLLFGVCQKYLLRLNRYAVIAVSTVLFFVTYNVGNGYLGFEGLFTIKLPELLTTRYDLYPLGFVSSGFFSSDYFPLLPWLFIFIIGAFLGSFAVEGRLPSFMYKKHIGVLAFLGRHSLIIYLLHQPIIYALLFLIYRLV